MTNADISDDDLMAMLDRHIHWKLLGETGPQAVYHSLRDAVEDASQRFEANESFGNLEHESGTPVINQDQIVRLAKRLSA